MSDTRRQGGFAAAAAAWIADPSDALEVLAHADLDVLGLISEASNQTLLCAVGGHVDTYAVYKPAHGERPLWDFPDGTLHRREVAAYRLSAHLGWGVVPPTVLRNGPLGPGSLQLFVPHDPADHYFSLVEDARWHPQLVRLAVFDLVTNNTDRKGGHILRGLVDDRLYGIDHGLTFHVQPKLRTVVWDLGGHPVPPPLRDDLAALAGRLDRADPPDGLADLLAPAELVVLAQRARRLARLEALPEVPPDRRPYPWPPL